MLSVTNFKVLSNYVLVAIQHRALNKKLRTAPIRAAGHLFPICTKVQKALLFSKRLYRASGEYHLYYHLSLYFGILATMENFYETFWNLYKQLSRATISPVLMIFVSSSTSSAIWQLWTRAYCVWSGLNKAKLICSYFRVREKHCSNVFTPRK